MITFVLHTDSQDSFKSLIGLVAVPIQGFYPDAFGASHQFIESRHGKAAFLCFKAVTNEGQLGIDESVRLVPVFGDIQNDDAAVDVDLRRRLRM